MILKNAILLWLTKTKQTVAVLYHWVGHYCSLCYGRHIDIPFQWKTPSDLIKKWKNPSLNIIDNTLVSKYWGIKTDFHTVDFSPWKFFCWNFKTKVASCENIKTTLQKTFRSKCDINFFEITLLPHNCLLWKFAIIVGNCS